jgi:hypothetical protein
MLIKMGPMLFLAPDDPSAGGQDGTGTDKGQPDNQQSKGGAAGGSVTALKPWMAQLSDDLKQNAILGGHSNPSSAYNFLLGKIAEMEGKQKDLKDTKTVTQTNYEKFSKSLKAEDDPLGGVGAFLQQKFQSMGLPQEDAESFFDEFQTAMDAEKTKVTKEGNKMTQKVLKELWGDKYDENINYMARTAQAAGDEKNELQGFLDATGASINPYVWEMMARVGKHLSEDIGIPGNAGGKAGYTNPYCPIDYSVPSK